MGIFRPCMDRFSSCASGSDEALRLPEQAAKAEKKMRTEKESVRSSSDGAVHLMSFLLGAAVGPCFPNAAVRWRFYTNFVSICDNTHSERISYGRMEGQNLVIEEFSLPGRE